MDSILDIPLSLIHQTVTFLIKRKVSVFVKVIEKLRQNSISSIKQIIV